MASSLLALLDDIATILDDVAVMTKVAAKKTAGVLGDDLALNAQQVTGVRPDRELPVVGAVAKGSAINKLILVPIALLINVFLPPWVTIALLMIGGAFLCYEGAEKVLHKFFHSKEEDQAHHLEIATANADETVDLVQFEKAKIKGAIRTDFILSAEIIVITLGTVADAVLSKKIGVLVAISVLMTIGVYGLVAAIVKLDDFGLHLSSKANQAAKALGRSILAFAPLLMKTLSFLGTAAMFLVGGSIILHGIPLLQKVVDGWLSGAGGASKFFIQTGADGIVGLVCGVLIVGIVAIFKRVRS